MDAVLVADIHFFPYYANNSVVDVILFGIWCFLFGFFFTLGSRVGSKIP